MKIAITATALILAAAPAFANCRPAEEMGAYLREDFGEVALGFGIEERKGRALSVFRSEDSGTWTIVEIHNDGEACIVASGTEWVDGPAMQTRGAPL